MNYEVLEVRNAKHVPLPQQMTNTRLPEQLPKWSVRLVRLI